MVAVPTFPGGPLKITQEIRAFAMQQAERRCECTGSNCRHHLRGSRCKRGLRGDDWKVYWKAEGGGATRGNIEAWCIECFANNFEAPTELVALLALDIAGYTSLAEEDRRRAITLKSVLRDAADRAARERRGRIVLDRLDDDVLLEFASTHDAVEAARAAHVGFRELAQRLEIDAPPISGAIHCGRVTRWRSGLVVGEAVDVTTNVRGRAGLGQILVTGQAAAPLGGKVPLEPVTLEASGSSSSVVEAWALLL